MNFFIPFGTFFVGIVVGCAVAVYYAGKRLDRSESSRIAAERPN